MNSTTDYTDDTDKKGKDFIRAVRVISGLFFMAIWIAKNENCAS
jgi:hypothetical protein